MGTPLFDLDAEMRRLCRLPVFAGGRLARELPALKGAPGRAAGPGLTSDLLEDLDPLAAASLREAPPLSSTSLISVVGCRYPRVGQRLPPSPDPGGP